MPVPGRILLATAAALVLGCAAAAVAEERRAPPPPEAERIIPGQRSGFVWDGAGGCWVWAGGLKRGVEGLTARWTGACPDGPAEGRGSSAITWREDGRERQMLHEGMLRRGKAEGPGRLTHLDNGEVVAVEEGEFADDYLARGRLEVPRSDILFEGGFRRGQPHGPGRLTTRGQVFEGQWENGCLLTKAGWISFTRPADDCEGSPT